MKSILDPADTFFNSKLYLVDYPQHRKFFRKFQVAPRHTMNADSTSLLDKMACLQATIQLLEPGGLRKELGLPIVGWCQPQEDMDGRFIVKVDCETPECNLVNVGGLIRMLGHFAEQVASDGRFAAGALALRHTSFDSAYSFLSQYYCLTIRDRIIRETADDLCAWTNAIFIAMATGLSTSHAAVGMAQDGMKNSLLGDFLQDYGLKLGKVIEEHDKSIRQEVLGGACGASLCKCIDARTTAVFMKMAEY